MADLATAYVQIIPTTKGIKGQLTEALDGEAESAGKSAGGKVLDGLKGGLKTTAKVIGAAAVAGTGAIVALTKSAVDSYANYEQLVGGVETLFGTQGMTISEYAQSVGKTVGEVQSEYASLESAQKTVMDNAAAAYKTAGISANEYMEQATSTAASLISSLGGDSEKAAQLADQAIIDMADNANKMGTSIENIQNAYGGFAKGNFTMLDNLKLGYGGTKQEMERLLEDAQKLSGVEYDISSYADIVEAIHVVQDEMGIAGATAEEAEGTISGSLGMLSASWSNLVTGMADKNANIDTLVSQVVDSMTAVGKNLMPVIETALTGIGKMIDAMAPVIIEKLPGIIESLFPVLLKAVTSLLNTLFTQLPALLSSLLPSVLDAVISLVETLVTQLPAILDSVLSAILEALKSIGERMPELLPSIVNMVLGIVDAIIDNVDLLIEAALALAIGLAEGLVKAIPEIIARIPEIVMKLVEALVKEAPQVLMGAVQLFMAIGQGLLEAVTGIPEMLASIVEGIIMTFINIAPSIGAFFQEAWDVICIVFEGAISFFQGIFDGICAVFSVVGEVIGAFFQAAWDLVVIIWNIAVSFFSAIWNGIVGVFSAVASFFSSVFSAAWNGITAIWNAVIGFFSGIWNGIVGVFSGVASFFSGVFSAAWNAITSIFNKLGSFFSGIWNAVVGIFRDAGVAVGDAISGAVRGAINAVLGGAVRIINGFISAINFAIGVINAIPGVNISRISQLSVPALASGGILKKGEIGLLEGSGAEAVVPLDQNKAWIHATAMDFIDELYSQRNVLMSRSMAGSRIPVAATAGGDGGEIIQGDIVLPIYIGSRQIERIVIDAEKIRDLRTGGR